jgi:hypothetical protein
LLEVLAPGLVEEQDWAVEEWDWEMEEQDWAMR